MLALDLRPPVRILLFPEVPPLLPAYRLYFWRLLYTEEKQNVLQLG